MTSTLISESRPTLRVLAETQRRRGTIVRYTLSFYGTLGFIAGFSLARLFATLNPTLTVARGGIHFHHFWDGLAIAAVTGWLGVGITTDGPGRPVGALFGI